MDTTDIRVLFLDDDPDLVDLAATVLEREYERMDVVTETDPDVALDRLADESVDCVVTDYQMGTVDGLELLRAVREQHADLPVVFFTGRGSEEIAAEAISLGVTDYLRKETGTEQFRVLGNRIESLVSGQRAKRAAADADRRIREVYERITVAFVALDDDLRFSYLNEQAERLLDRDADALVGASLLEAFPGAEGTTVEETLRTALDEQHERHADVEFHIDDRHLHVEVHVYPGADGISVFLEDRSEAVERERELEQLREELEISEGQFRTLRQKLSRPPGPFR
jgi:PAS domain S-box-containing protein